MTDQAQPSERSASPASSAAGYRDDERRLKADPILTERHERLDIALNGPTPARGHGALNWNGTDETTADFDSIVQALEASIPVDRPTSDLPQESDTQQAGS